MRTLCSFAHVQDWILAFWPSLMANCWSCCLSASVRRETSTFARPPPSPSIVIVCESRKVSEVYRRSRGLVRRGVALCVWMCCDGGKFLVMMMLNTTFWWSVHAELPSHFELSPRIYSRAFPCYGDSQIIVAKPSKLRRSKKDPEKTCT